MIHEQSSDTGLLASDRILVRKLGLGDVEAVVRIDEASTGLRRVDFYHQRIERSLNESSVHLSLAAEMDGMVVGFVTVSFFFGEFGMAEPVAVLDAIGVHPDYRRAQVGQAMLEQLERNLQALRVERLRTEVDWDRFELLSFMRKMDFAPAARLCLEKRIGA
jgi:GNAT superfamily N-acetyltransferase